MTGPCSHCGIRGSLIWRAGPPDKPVLCYNCEIWWRLNGSLRNRISEHQSNLFPRLLPSAQVAAAFSAIANNNNTQPPTLFQGNAATQSNPSWKPWWNPYHVLRKRRSAMEHCGQRGGSTMIYGKKLKQPNTTEQDEEKEEEEEDDDRDYYSDSESVLIFERVNKNIPENEIGHGCMLLNPLN